VRPPWREFWRRVLSPPTARFILALLALLASSGAVYWLLIEGVAPDGEQVVIFAIGQLIGLTYLAFGYYFGSTARGDESPHEIEITNPPNKPVPVEEER